MPKCITLGSEYDSFKVAAFIGSISPIKSATVTSGVANFSKNLSFLLTQSMGVASPNSKILFLAK